MGDGSGDGETDGERLVHKEGAELAESVDRRGVVAREYSITDSYDMEVGNSYSSPSSSSSYRAS